tara:strand:- start:1217 stop:1408 length:192 start_codon:yes stop_codon:yes gene_type:complete
VAGIRQQEAGDKGQGQPEIQKSPILRQSCPTYRFFKTLIFEISTFKTGTTGQLGQPIGAARKL